MAGLLSILRISTNPKYSIEICRKIFLKIKENGSNEYELARTWASSQAVSWESISTDIPQSLNVETNEYLAEQYRAGVRMSEDLKQQVDIDLGGGGHVALLYALVRALKPSAALETGVAAGHSTRAILTAMDKNQRGVLYSSDFPYFRVSGGRKLIGYVVPEEIRYRWKLLTQGDRKNLKQILSDKYLRFEFVHYDSDKRKSSRLWFYSKIKSYLSNQYVLIFDDIQDDLSFKEIVLNESLEYVVLEWEGKFLGVILGNCPLENLFHLSLNE